MTRFLHIAHRVVRPWRGRRLLVTLGMAGVLAGSGCMTRSPAPESVPASGLWQPAGPAAAEGSGPKVPAPVAAAATEWLSLFNGHDLGQWHRLKDDEYQSNGAVGVADGVITLAAGMPYSGIVWGGTVPKDNYEFALEAERRNGYDIFCGLFFPVGDSAVTMIMGGWGDTVVGLSCIDDFVAADNESTQIMSFENDQWYRVRVRVTTARIQAWIDDEEQINVAREGKRFSPYPGLEALAPFGIFTWQTGSGIRNVRLRRLPASELGE